MAAPEESRTVPDSRAEFTCAQDEGQHSRLPRRANAASNPAVDGRFLLSTYTSPAVERCHFHIVNASPHCGLPTAGNRTCTSGAFARLWFYAIAIIAARDETVRC